MEKGKLYLVATPIGNLGDITYRAVEILKAVDVIAAEDTRQTLKLLNYLDIKKSMFSYHRHNEDFKVEKIMEFLEDGKDVAIVTDAGTPGISDPGEVAVKEAIDRNIEIIPIPGACALVNALIASGLNTKNPCAKPRGINNCRLLVSLNSTATYFPKVGEERRKSTATSNTLPLITRTSLACAASPF